MSQYTNDIKAVTALRQAQGSKWEAINPEYAARMRAQNKFKTGLDIAKYTAKIMREDMANYDADTAQYTQSLGCWHGFIGQQKLIQPERLGTTVVDEDGGVVTRPFPVAALIGDQQLVV